MIQEKLIPFKNSFQSVVIMSAVQKFEKKYTAESETGILRAGIEVFNKLLINKEVESYENIKVSLGEAYFKRNELYPHTIIATRNANGYRVYADNIEGKPFMFTEWVIAIESIATSMGFSITQLMWDYEKRLSEIK